MALPDYTPTDYENWTGDDEWNAIYTISIGELQESGIFDWKRPLLDWSKAAYSDEQYSRVCEYFIERFRFREISMEPFYQWATILHRKLIWELMPKYRLMYQMLDDKFDFAQEGSEDITRNEKTSSNSDRYGKSRDVESEYPETMLSGNSDYASRGNDSEHEDIDERNGTEDETRQHVERGPLLDKYLQYQQEFQAIDKQLLDELECMFVPFYTVSLDGM